MVRGGVGTKGVGDGGRMGWTGTSVGGGEGSGAFGVGVGVGKVSGTGSVSS